MADLDPFSIGVAKRRDASDPLSAMREKFHFPLDSRGHPVLYLCGNSLGLQPKSTREHVLGELDDWARLGVEGHFRATNPWYTYHELLSEPMARVVGALPSEVVVMNSLTTNLHLLMVSFYRPTAQRHKILIESGTFPSDRYVVSSQAHFHGYEAPESILELAPRPGELLLRTEDILETIERQGAEIALILLGGVNYYTGQAFDMKAITEAGHAQGCAVGFDLAHAAGNLDLELHDWNVDFGAWCTYKYLNAGPGGVAGAFVHDRHARQSDLPRFAGWWGNDPKTRFEMPDTFIPQRGAAGWQLSNAPVLPMAALKASLEIFDQASMAALQHKAIELTEYAIKQIDAHQRARPDSILSILTPREPSARGAQLSLVTQGALAGQARRIHGWLTERSVICDFREPDVIRIAPAPLYTRFEDVHRAIDLLFECVS